jgi:hypothetical protein
MQLSKIENDIFDDLVQDSHELWEWYAFVGYNHPELSEEDVIGRGRALLVSWVEREWLEAFKSRANKDTVSGGELLSAVDKLGSHAASPQKENIVLHLTPRALRDIGRSPKFHEGKRYVNPDAFGEIVRTQSGFATASVPVRQGPYAKISKDGKITYTPLAGNPTLTNGPEEHEAGQ